jgi:MSHA pilin protein MshA
VKSYQNKSSGFTLIELIVVIVILGIMAAVAGPKFVDLQKDARVSVMQGIEGSVRSTATLIYSKALIAGQETLAVGSVTVSGSAVATAFGYPALAEINGLIDLSGAPDIDATTNGTLLYTGKTTCKVDYAVPGSAGAPPTITPVPAVNDC